MESLALSSPYVWVLFVAPLIGHFAGLLNCTGKSSFSKHVISEFRQVSWLGGPLAGEWKRNKKVSHNRVNLFLEWYRHLCMQLFVQRKFMPDLLFFFFIFLLSESLESLYLPGQEYLYDQSQLESYFILHKGCSLGDSYTERQCIRKTACGFPGFYPVYPVVHPFNVTVLNLCAPGISITTLQICCYFGDLELSLYKISELFVDSILHDANLIPFVFHGQSRDFSLNFI